MGDKKEPTKKKQQQHHLSSSPNDLVDHESTETKPSPLTHHQQHSPAAVVAGASPFISTPLHIPTSVANFDPQQFDPVNPKRPRYTSAQWKTLPSASQPPQKQTQLITLATEPQPHITAVSSSETASSPSHSPSPSSSKPEGGEQFQHQFRKGKFVSPVWKPNEMLWLARAWKAQYQGTDVEGTPASGGDVATGTPPSRGKTRADKDREVAEFLNQHGVSRNSKTAGTKWDNMLGEFRKVYEWERGGEREQVGKSYFRLSPYERKLHRLPASFDEEVFEELSQFMGSKMRIPQGRGVIISGFGDDSPSPRAAAKGIPPHPPFIDEDVSLCGRTRQLVLATGGEAYFHGTRGSLLGLESSLDISGPSASTSSKEFRRIGKIRMIWEESVSLWAEEGEHHRGRVRVIGSNFLEADELTFLDDSMVACTMEAFEDGPFKGFSVDRFISGQQIKVFGRRKSSTVPPAPSVAPPWECQDPTEYYIGCLRLPPATLPTLLELSWHLQDPPPEELRFPLRKDVYRDLPQGKELFFTTTSELLDCRAITFDLLGPIIRSNPSLTASTASTRDSFIGLWDDCVNRVVSKFCSIEVVMVRKNSNSSSAETVDQDQWPNVTGFLRNFCLWRGEESDQLREGHIDPSSSIVQKLLWSYTDLPYILGYYAVGYIITFCALSRSQDRIVRTDLYTLDLSTPAERMKALVPCWRIAGLFPLLADRCFNFVNNGNYKPIPFTDFERIDLGNGNIAETTPNTVIRYFSSKGKWSAVKEIYDFLDRRIPHTEFIVRSSEKDLALVFKPRGCKFKPTNCDELVEALKHVTKALVALHDLSFMHRDLGWDKVMRGVERSESEWFLVGFDEAVGAPQIYPHSAAGGRHAPEMGRGLHGVKVDVWGVGQLVKSCGLVGVPKLLRELQNRCLDHNQEQRPTAADCYHHLLQLQSSLQSAVAASGGY